MVEAGVEVVVMVVAVAEVIAIAVDGKMIIFFCNWHLWLICFFTAIIDDEAFHEADLDQGMYLL